MTTEKRTMVKEENSQEIAEEVSDSEEKAVTSILSLLDTLYGTVKDNFRYQEPWQLLIAIILSAQSTDKQVEKVLPDLFRRFPTVKDVAEAGQGEIEGCIRSVGLYKHKAENIKKCCCRLLNEYNGQVPDNMEQLLSLPGVGRKTATLFLADAFGIPGITVDTHVFRISKRLGWARGKNPHTVEKELERVLPREHWNRINFQLISLGREVCTSRRAHCERCPLKDLCRKQIREPVKQEEEAVDP